ncbi:MAG: hypothetical protein IIX19_00390 [Alistipes sp.]|nr:hypothetical protein [Alistipes sp.]
MKIKNLLLALLALPLMMVACEPNNPVDEVKDPTVAVTAGVTTENTIAFTVTSTEAKKVAYIVVEGSEAPTASEVLANGTEIEANKNVELTATELEAETEYTIVAAAQNTKAVVKATATAKTLVVGETPKTSLTLKSASEMSFGAEGGEGEIEYEIINSVPGAVVEATADVEWINATAGEKISFTVASNDGAAREGKIVVSYHNDEFEVLVKQAATGEQPEPSNVEFVATKIVTDYSNEEGLNIYVFELGDKEWSDNGWGVDGGTYYSFAIVSANKGNGVLPNGTYSLSDSYSANTIISEYAYRYQMKDGVPANGFEVYKDANVVITDGKIEANIELERDGSIHHVVFEGSLAVEDGGSQQPTEFEATHVADKWYWGGSSTYGYKYMVAGEGFSVDVHFQPKNASETAIVAGEYTWTTTTMWGYNDFEEFTTRTFTVDGQSVAVDGGMAVVSNEGDEYHIEMTLEGRDGFVYMIEYNGKLNDKGNVGGEDNTLVVNTLGEGSYNSSYYFYTFKAEGENFSFDLLVNEYQAKNNQILAGSYTYAPGKSYAGNKNCFYIDSFKLDGVTYKASEASTMSVEGDGTNVSIRMNLVMQSGDMFVVTFNGVVGGSANEGGSTELTKLATPSVSGLVSGNAATVSWNEIAGAKDYTVTLNGTDVKTVTTAYIVYQDLAWETTYSVSVVANPADSSVNSASDAGTATFTTEANPGSGDEGGNTGGEDYTDWNFSAFYDTSTAIITLTGKEDGRVISAKTDELAFSKFYADPTRPDYISDITVDGVATTDVTPDSYIEIRQTHVNISLVINGVTYTGTSNGFSY